MAEEFIESIKEFDAYLVGNFVGKILDYIFVMDTLCKTWKLKGPVDGTLQNNNIFFFKFSSSEEKDRVLEMGSQFIISRFFINRLWRPFVEIEKSELKTIPIWVNLKKVLSHLWTSHGIGKITSFIGTPLFLDKVTKDRTRTSFARVCVKVDIDQDLPKYHPYCLLGVEKVGWEKPRKTARYRPTSSTSGIIARIPIDLTEEIIKMTEKGPISSVEIKDKDQLVSTTDEEFGPIISYGIPRVGPSGEDASLLSKRVEQEVVATRDKHPKDPNP
ncbi:hypothetical protein GIB67_019880 [Kingdonia uniflora]|uniref:DUF4283 domain-containing protein n=1 Tax=Kingdonia uniflora TaxID=39325 RepID=A0A7J7MKM9_9MAGN|nr:hypothetical protein GIB67_019880 [Kingdonia uniflora]